MESTVPAGSVVVGYDGSSRSQHAVEYAAGEAGRRRTGLHILHAVPPLSSRPEHDAAAVKELVAAAERLVEEAAQDVRAAHPDLQVSAAARIGTPSVELVDASADAAVVVVGARGLGRLAGVLLGSVSQKVAAHAHGPVVVVREDHVSADGPVVVGIDPGDGSPEAMQFAFDEAARRGVGVRVVYSRYREAVSGDYMDSSAMQVLAEMDERNDQEVRDRVEQWSARYPDIPVTLDQTHEHPVTALSDAAATASVVVVGSRGRGGLAGLLLGSVSRGALHRAPVVAVVRVLGPRPDGS